MKLLLTKSDHRKYNLKDKKLIKVFSEILGSDQEEMLTDLEQGDVSETLRKFFKDSGLSVKRSTLTLKQVDDFLDHLTTISKHNEQVRAFERHFVNKCTPDDLKFITRIVVGDLKTYAGAKFILGALHPDAYNVFTISNDLKGVVERSLKGEEMSQSQTINASFNDDDFEKILSKPKKEFNPEEDLKVSESESGSESDEKKKKKDKKKKKKKDESDSEDDSKGKKKKSTKMKAYINLMTPIKPMLARASKTYEDAIKRLSNGFFIETKYDGERIQIHKDGKNFKFFSRNLKPVTENKVEEVKKYILKSIDEDKVVLDGEILLVDINSGKPLPFGTLGKHKKTQFKDAVVGIFLFDILYYDGKGLLNVPFEKRRQVLEKVVKVIPNRIMLSEYDLCVGSNEDKEVLLSAKMTNAIEQGLEGLVLKDIQGVYEPAARHWIKMKKDYLKGMADSADLLVLGAYYGSGSKGGKISVFLMGCYNEAEEKYVTVCKCGNGHDDDTIDQLQNKFIPKMTKIQQDFSKLPDWLDCDRSMVPDWVITDPKDTDVWEISGAEFSKSTRFPLGISIRFPRVTRIRDDKSPEDATTAKDLKRLFETSKQTGGQQVLLKDVIKKKKPTQSEKEMEGSGKRKKEESEEKEEKPKKKKKKDSDDEEEEEKPKKEKKEKKKKGSDDEEEEKPIKKKVEKIEQDEDDLDTDIPGTLKYLFENLTDAFGLGGKVLVHSVDNSGNWSSRGTMGQISQKYKQAEKEYKQNHNEKINSRVGDIQMVKISSSPDLYVCNMVAQKATGKGGAPPINYEGLEKGLKELAKESKKNRLSIHFSKFHSSVPGLDWKKVEKMIKDLLIKKGLDVTIYTKDPADKNLCEQKGKKEESKEETKKEEKKEEKKEPYEEMDIETRFDQDDEPKQVSKKESSQPKESSQSSQKEKVENIFKGVYAVISGYSEPETKEIAKLLETNGAKISQKWNVKGDGKSTHLICETFTKVYDHVENLGGMVVKRKWIDESIEQKKKLKENQYLYPQPKKEVKKEVPKESSQPKEVKKQVTKDKNGLYDIFSNCVFFIDETITDPKLKRYIIAYDGIVLDQYDENVTHILTNKDSGYPKSKIYSSKWVWETINQGLKN